MSKDAYQVFEVIVKGVGALMAVLAIICLAGLLVAIPVYFLWNWVGVELGARPITYFQALGLYVLSQMLFRGSGVPWKGKDD